MSHGHHHELGPSYTGSVVLELGPSVGALIIYTGPEQHGREIEISPVGSDQRTHSAVRERRLDGRTLYGAVYPGLAAGTYTIWDDEVTPVSTVEVPESGVAQYTWPALG
jgi:hypothetical protein